MAHLLLPLDIRGLGLKNRIVMPPMATRSALPDGTVSDGMLSNYNEKSRGGCLGLVIIEHGAVTPNGVASVGQLSVAGDDVIPSLRKLVETIHANGCAVVMQISHAGAFAPSEITGERAVAPSSVPELYEKLGNPSVGKLRVLDPVDIARVILAFGEAGRRAKAAGFDGVEIHAAHGYLLSQFFSPLSNRRTDEYGGSLEGRMRLHLQIIHTVRASVGDMFPVLLRLGASDFIKGGATIEDGVAAAVACVGAGADLIDVSGGLRGYSVPELTGEGYFSGLSEKIKLAVPVPVMVTGGIATPQAADNLVATGKADLVGVGRALLRDPQWACKALKTLSEKLSN
ncbi:MAG TPA: NADH:flavin oxidoreductase [Spirochaetia bacterium]|nr:NADH:flavin oxidoreductase [Spirochaetia bacterium]